MALGTQIIITEDLAEDHQQTNSNDEVIFIDAAENKIFHINDSGRILKVKAVNKIGIG